MLLNTWISEGETKLQEQRLDRSRSHRWRGLQKCRRNGHFLCLRFCVRRRRRRRSSLGRRQRRPNPGGWVIEALSPSPYEAGGYCVPPQYLTLQRRYFLIASFLDFLHFPLRRFPVSPFARSRHLTSVLIAVFNFLIRNWHLADIASILFRTQVFLLTFYCIIPHQRLRGFFWLKYTL